MFTRNITVLLKVITTIKEKNPSKIATNINENSKKDK